MSKNMSDPLLAIATVIVVLGQILMIVIGALAVLAIPATMIFRDVFLSELRSEFPNYALTYPTATVGALLLCVIALVAMFWLFLRKLRQIIDTVGAGDPFVPANAKRLTAMAWLMLGIQLLSLPAAGLALYFAKSLGEKAGTIDASFDLSGVVLVVTLFILARVFRHGAAMREDLEGTV